MTPCPHYKVHRDHAQVSYHCHLIHQDVMCRGQREACEPVSEIEDSYRIKFLVQAG